MIDPKELRIGNWVYDTYDIANARNPVQVLSLHEINGHTSINASSANDYYPIPLSPEVLMEFGFVNSPAGNSTYKSIPELKAEIHFENFRGELVCVLYCSTGSFIPNDIKYVHQAQNLYFALTGEELTYNPNQP